MPTKYCRHLRVNGERCGSPALTSNPFCYFHVELERRHRRLKKRLEATPFVPGPRYLQDGSQREPVSTESSSRLDLPPLEDRQSIQVALSLVIAALAEDRIDPKQATLLFYGLQVASSNAHLLNPIPKRAFVKVINPVLDESHSALIAPDEDPEYVEDEVKGSATKYWEMLIAEDEDKERLRVETLAKSIADAVAIGLAELTATFNTLNALTPANLQAASHRIEEVAAATSGQQITSGATQKVVESQ